MNSSKNVFNSINRICHLNGINQELIKNIECDVRDKRIIEEIFQKSKDKKKKFKV